MEFQAAVFDMDGILIDSEILVIKCWKEIAEKYGIPRIEETCRLCLGINSAATIRVFKQQYGEDFPYDTYKEEMRELFVARLEAGELQLKKGVKELLQALREHGKKIAVASSTRREMVQHELGFLGVIDFFDTLICGDMIANGKPAPDIFLKACEMLGEKPENSIGLEDSFNGIRSCSSAGLHTIMVPDLLAPTEEIRALCDTVLPSMVEVKEYLFPEK